MSLTLEQISALRDLESTWPGVDAVVIGATALGFYFDMRWRQTFDVDLGGQESHGGRANRVEQRGGHEFGRTRSSL